MESILDNITIIISKIIYYILNEIFVGKNIDFNFSEYINSKSFANLFSLSEIAKIDSIECFSNILNDVKKERLIAMYEENPVTEYKDTRLMKRKFYIHSGPTNSGKTYEAIEDLKMAQNGMYLCPLRLLAIEVREKLENSGVKCDLITGEEEIKSIGSKHISATVERADYENTYEVVVIDECQMIGDKDRGGSWTNAIMGVKSNIIHICTSPSALSLIVKLIEMCNDEYEIVNHTRNTELVMDSDNFNSFDDCKKGDALVVFSKKNVLSVASLLMEKGIKSSIIYGSLPYKTRTYQMQRFLNGETDVVVTTDAISMGLNLPIRRVVFVDTYKYDGCSNRSLYDEEVRQIAGRAGRYGIYDIGYVNALNNYSEIKNKLNRPYATLDKAKLNVPISILDAEGDLSNNIKVWASIDTYKDFEKVNVDKIIDNLNIIKNMGYDGLGNRFKYTLSTMYFDSGNKYVVSLWMHYIDKYFGDLEDVLAKPCLDDYTNDLYGLESYYKSIELYYTFSKTFNLEYDAEWIREEKLKISIKINDVLISDVKKYKKRCGDCGKDLEWNSTNLLCPKCAMEKVLMKHAGGSIRIKRA